MGTFFFAFLGMVVYGATCYKSTSCLPALGVSMVTIGALWGGCMIFMWIIGKIYFQVESNVKAFNIWSNERFFSMHAAPRDPMYINSGLKISDYDGCC
jgi:hypothetical protein